jgi:hypothetical protein
VLLKQEKFWLALKFFPNSIIPLLSILSVTPNANWLLPEKIIFPESLIYRKFLLLQIFPSLPFPHPYFIAAKDELEGIIILPFFAPFIIVL